MQAMQEIIQNSYPDSENIPGLKGGRYDLLGPNNEIILPSYWEHVVKPGWRITMAMWPLDKASQREKLVRTPQVLLSTSKALVRTSKALVRRALPPAIPPKPHFLRFQSLQKLKLRELQPPTKFLEELRRGGAQRMSATVSTSKALVRTSKALARRALPPAVPPKPYVLCFQPLQKLKSQGLEVPKKTLEELRKGGEQCMSVTVRATVACKKDAGSQIQKLKSQELADPMKTLGKLRKGGVQRMGATMGATIAFKKGMGCRIRAGLGK
ncbi:hypothetical protein IMZ48_04220 [Candidatus Bathyarchaeota archaeon]|nr:hypothetical protein [Candidatus Bathyarchaeota archaeon]